MDGGTAILALGLLLMVAAVTGGYLVPTAVRRREGSSDSGPSTVSRWSWLAVGIIGLLAALWGAYLQLQDVSNGSSGDPASQSSDATSESPTPVITISFPHEGAVIPQSVESSGRARNIPADHNLWAAVEVNGEYFLQQGPIQIGSGGDWQARVLVGGEADSGLAYTLWILETGPDGTKAFSDYLQAARRNGESLPIGELGLPLDDLQWRADVHVIRG